MKRILDRYETPTGTIVEVFHHDAETDTVRIQTHHDIDLEPLVEAAEVVGPDNVAEGMRLQRFIPSHVLDQMLREGWFNDPAKLRAWANSPEGLACAVPVNGRVQRL